jgi:hypothetical protein
VIPTCFDAIGIGIPWPLNFSTSLILAMICSTPCRLFAIRSPLASSLSMTFREGTTLRVEQFLGGQTLSCSQHSLLRLELAQEDDGPVSCLCNLQQALLPQVRNCERLEWRFLHKCRSDVVDRTGLEPVTPCVSLVGSMQSDGSRCPQTTITGLQLALIDNRCNSTQTAKIHAPG